MEGCHFVGRADLLRALVGLHGQDGSGKGNEAAATEQRLAGLLGLHARQAEPSAQEVRVRPSARESYGGRPADTPPKASVARRPPLQTRFFAILSSERLAEPSASTAPYLQPLGPEDCAPRKSGEPPHAPLVGRTRLWPALHRTLACPRLGRVDVPALVRALSKARPLNRLPRKKFRNWSAELVVVLDLAHRLIPYDTDYAQLLKEVRRLHGQAGVTVWTVMDSPEATLAVRRGRSPAQSAKGPIPLPPSGTPVLLLGDFGMLSSGRQAEPAWVDFCRRFDEAGVQTVAWVPCSGSLVSAGLARHARIHCLGDGDLYPIARPGIVRPSFPGEALEALLIRIACCVRAEPALLRSLRRIRADTAAEPGLEGLLWSHAPVVLAGQRFCEIAPEYQATYRARFEALDAATQAEILRRMLDAHAHRGRSTESAEALIWRAHVRREALPADLAGRVEEADAWFARLAGQPGEAPGDAAAYARDLIARHGGDSAWVRANSRHLASLWALTGASEIPAGLDSADVARARKAANTVPFAYELVQQGERLWLSAKQPAKKPTRAPASVWPEIEIQGGCEWSRADGTHGLWATPGKKELELPLAADPAATAYHLVSAGWRYRIGLLSRPSWALEWGYDEDGIYALAPSPLGEPVKLRWSGGEHPRQAGGWPPSPRAFLSAARKIAPGMRIGADMPHGLYLDVDFLGVTQRFRWIEPGEFLMGSPADEFGRYENEGLRHLVRITQGYWLADTACSQALWQVVMDTNPSRFDNDPQNPVEQVNWHDVQSFLHRFEARLHGVRAELPTEAEWEYACRAGMETPFNFGATITPERANYNGALAYPGGMAGKYRRKTVPVKSFQPNVWGLYQMHGNVGEWCADGRRDYGGFPQVDPRGPDGDRAWRIVRGGSWNNGPGALRSAYRLRWRRALRNDFLGFRFSLRPASPEGMREAAWDVDSGRGNTEQVTRSGRAEFYFGGVEADDSRPRLRLKPKRK